MTEANVGWPLLMRQMCPTVVSHLEYEKWIFR
jgi:hypothetical protein